jgi:hypothetical protein
LRQVGDVVELLIAAQLAEPAAGAPAPQEGDLRPPEGAAQAQRPEGRADM